jgi:hypothetical protein
MDPPWIDGPAEPEPKFEISIVPAPKCEACGSEMAPASDIEWKCEQLSCGGYGSHVHTGVYPLRKRTNLIVDDIEGPPTTGEQRKAFRKWVEDYDIKEGDDGPQY